MTLGPNLAALQSGHKSSELRWGVSDQTNVVVVVVVVLVALLRRSSGRKLSASQSQWGRRVEFQLEASVWLPSSSSPPPPIESLNKQTNMDELCCFIGAVESTPAGLATAHRKEPPEFILTKQSERQ